VRLERLVLDRYGAAAGRAVDFAPGLTVIFGPNEAGKSTIRYAIGDVIWGLRSRNHPYAFNWSAGRLGITCTMGGLSPDSSDSLVLRVDSRGHHLADGTAYDPPWMNGAVQSRDAWATALGMDVNTLRNGGNAVVRDGGDLREMLFHARSGVDLSEALAELREHADSLYRRHGGARNVTVRVLSEAVVGARQATTDATSTGDQVARLRDDFAKA
jgi:uncharacterized protein YhaN